MTEAWPTGTINLGVVRTSYSETIEDSVQRSKPEAGPPLERSLSSIVSPILSFEGRYTAAEWAALYAFWKTTLIRGTSPFTRAHPLTAASTLFKFESAPRLVAVGATLRHVALVLRTLP